MTQREKKLLKLLGVLVGVLFLAAALYVPYVTARDYFNQRSERADLQKKLQSKQTELLEKERYRAQVLHWRSLSLPPNREAANLRYQEMLTDLVRKHGLVIKSKPRYEAPRSVVSIAPGQTNPHALRNPSFTFELQGNLSKLVALLREFYAMNLPHQIKEFTVEQEPKEPLGTLNIEIKVEVLAMPDVPNREWLVATPNVGMLWVDLLSGLKHGPVGLAVIPYMVSPTGPLGAKKLASNHHPERDYSKMVAKNPFTGLALPPPPPPPTKPRPPETKPVVVMPPPPTKPRETPPDRSVLKNYQLTSIHSRDTELEGSLLDRQSMKPIVLSAASGKNKLEIKDKSGKLVLSAMVRKVLLRVVLLESEEKVYALYVGDFLHEALMNSLNESEIQQLEMLYAATVQNP